MCIGKRMWRVGSWSLLAFLLTWVIGNAAVAGTLEEVKQRGELVVGVKTDFPPFGYVDSSGKNLGFDVDLAHAFSQALFNDANKIKFVSVTSGNRIPYLQSRKIDIIMASMTITDKRAEVVEFSKPYFMSGSLILVPKDSSIKTIEDLAGKTVAVIQGSVQVSDVGELAPEADVTEFGTVSQAVQALKSGRADAYVHDDIVILTLAKEHQDLKPVGEVIRPRPYGIAVRKGDTAFIGWVNEQLAQMKNDGSFDKLWKKHFGDVEAMLVKPD